jgi:hypothetical protein
VIKFYPFWYPARWVGRGQIPVSFSEFGKLAKHMRYAERHARKLGRSLFHAMVVIGPKLEKRQMVLFRCVDIGAELFAMSAACVRARMLAQRGQSGVSELADVFCREARVRIERLFDELFARNDPALYRLAQRVLAGDYAWLEEGIARHPRRGQKQSGAARRAAPLERESELVRAP